MISLEEQIAAVERELKFRQKVYPRWVRSKPPKITQAAAEQELARMKAVRESLLTLRRMRDGDVSP